MAVGAFGEVTSGSQGLTEGAALLTLFDHVHRNQWMWSLYQVVLWEEGVSLFVNETYVER